MICFASQGLDCSARVCVADVDCFNGANCTVAGGANVVCSCTAGFAGTNCRVATTTRSDVPVGIIVGVVVAVVVIGVVIGVSIFAYHKHATNKYTKRMNTELRVNAHALQ